MKVYIVTHYIDCEYDDIEKVFSSKEKAEEYQELMRKEYKCPRYYISRKGEKLYTIEDFYVYEYEVESSVDRPQGKWIDKCGNKVCVCSSCGEGYDHTYEWIERWNYCPNCGAKMKGADDD